VEAGGGLDGMRFHGPESATVVGMGFAIGAGARWDRFSLVIRVTGASPLVPLPGLYALGLQARFAVASNVALALGGGAALAVPLGTVTQAAGPSEFTGGGVVNAALRFTIWSGRRSLLQLPVECNYAKFRDGFDAQWIRVGLEWAR